MSIDVSVPRKCIYGYFDDNPGPCPECGSTLKQQMATYLVLTRCGDEETGSFITGDDSGWFCPQCPTLLLDLSGIRESLPIGLPAWNVGDEFAVAGIVDIHAIPDDKEHLPLDHPDNPLPLVRFTEIVDDDLPEIEKDERFEKDEESLLQHWRRRILGEEVMEGDHAMTEQDYPEPVSKLLTMGEPEVHEWSDYLALGLSPEHVPDLICMALGDAPSDDPAIWGPIHAWRALGQLRAEEAIEPLIQLLQDIDDFDDDWISEEMPTVFALIGPAAIPALANYVLDTSHGTWARVAAAHSLEEIGTNHPDVRSACVSVLTAALERFETLEPEVNGFLVLYLVDLEAVEAAPIMERAFEAGRVDPMVMGDWEDVQVELGLLEERSTPRPSLFGDLGGKFAGLVSASEKSEARRRLRELGRNDPCWCGSGKKYKHCHLREDQQEARG
ncbi:MAG: DUF1186 domain-containing protein [Anaerolineae bacterium]